MKETIETERLRLRAPRLADAQAVTDIVSDPRIYEKVARIPPRQTLQQSETWLRSAIHGRDLDTDHVYMIEFSGELVGSVGAHRRGQGETFEIGYWLAPSYWGRGIVTEAAAALIEELEAQGKADTLVSGHFKDNPASARVLEKLGFSRDREGLVYCLGRDAHIEHIYVVRTAKAE